MGARILLAGGGTGGHLMPALNLAAALREARPDVELMLVGAERGIEARVLPEAGVPFRLLPMQPLSRRRPLDNWRLLSTAPAVVAGLARIFRELDPQVVVGTGGYASGPAVLHGIFAGRRTALQEQNAIPGLVTRRLAPRVDMVFLGYPEAADHLQAGARTRVLAWGNPVAARRPNGMQNGAGGFRWPEGRVVAVIGGSQGARGLNDQLAADLAAARRWPEGTTLVWVTGPDHLTSVREAVEATPWAERILTVAWIDDLGARLSGIDLAIARSGAMFCSELAVAGVPAVFVPFPAAAGNHQVHNAAALEAAGAAVMLEERSMKTGDLWEEVLALLAEEERLLQMAEAMASRGRPDASGRIAGELLDLAADRSTEDGARRTLDDSAVRTDV
ncbi:MAG: UDP-N-acetylglucosamine--N-acetylmuramyl-(pentapeptide) pyrophosphoryl-undecaprenol N-acetylglucosamine transferase [marine benthic group bacterium]|nr:UDP-N-acetylglucosamine--N-acetylmuramyl-(pentapeptide) pyrophosphoryl-undecaprenol N-acetylglucosamine transferase [Gemmatimonadota bacterium]